MISAKQKLMEAIAKYKGLKLNQEFQIVGWETTYKITEYGISIRSDFGWEYSHLQLNKLIQSDIKKENI